MQRWYVLTDGTYYIRKVMEYRVVTLGKLFDVDMRTIRRYLMKVCEKLGYRGIRTYHFRKLYYGIKCVR